MKKVINLWTSSSLVLKIFIGLVIGAVLGVVFPGGNVITILGDVFVGALRL